jgi:hypothetical protein
MELRSANGGANWHPLTSLITFDSTAESSVRFMTPFLGDDAAEFSTYMHEVTHLMCARYGRLGIFLSRTAAIYYKPWKENPIGNLALSRGESKMIAAFVPLLEGLALYAQLDFEAQDHEGLHYSPLFLVGNMASITRFAFGRSLKEIFSIGRSFGSGGSNISLIRALFLDQNREDLNYYLWGYLYIKALQALWGGRCSAFNHPANFLPLAIKFITEHPVIERFNAPQLTIEEILHAVHQTLTGLKKADLGYLSTLFGSQREKEFDRCDIYEQLRERPVGKICLFNQETLGSTFLSGLDEPTSFWLARFRACNWTYIYAWAEGQLEQESKDFSWIVTTANEKVEIVIPSSIALWEERLEQKIRTITEPTMREVFAKAGRDLAYLEQQFYQQLEAHKGQNICIAGFITLFGSMPGVGLWVNNQLTSFSLTDPLQYADLVSKNQWKEHAEFLGMGLAISPSDRKAFAAAFNKDAATQHLTTTAGAYLLQYLSSDPENRKELRGRLYRPWRRQLEAAYAWSDFSIRPSPLPDSLIDLADELFDLEGFAAENEPRKITFRDLLPDPYRFVKTFYDHEQK